MVVLCVRLKEVQEMTVTLHSEKGWIVLNMHINVLFYIEHIVLL